MIVEDAVLAAATVGHPTATATLNVNDDIEAQLADMHGELPDLQVENFR